MTTTNDPLIGATYDGRYLIDRRIGSGGMANVYLAQDETLGRRVAIKVLHQRYAEDSQFVERFLREASAAAKLNHPNIVQVYDRGQASGSYYIAMEYIEGMTLKDLVRRRGALTEQEVLAYGRQALHALRFAHRNGIVHRDVKPQNMMVDTDGRLKIADFGIARAAADADQGLTEAGSIVGTAQYLSPEQAQGQDVSAPSDLYSLGVVMFEMCTGRVPFDGDSPVNVALKHVKDPVPRPSTFSAKITPALESIILKALEKDAARRYGSADEMLADLDRARDGATTQAMTQVLPGAAGAGAASTRVQPIVPPPVTPPRAYSQPVAPEPAWPERSWDEDSRDEKRSPWVWLAPLLIVLLLAIAAGTYILLNRDQGTPVPDVVGMRVAEARVELTEAGFVLGEQTEQSSDEPVGTVLEQDPGDGTEAEEGAEVDVVVSKGPAPIEVPTVAGETQAAAIAAIRAAGFTAAPTVRKVADDDVEEGQVISSNPAAGAEAARTTKIVLNVSTGPEANAVPNVVGETYESAKSQLEE
ncbi:MAG: pknB, partial [Thermoleophilia bacterium]|nr:pknB [Thermoleophilia bacterium]